MYGYIYKTTNKLNGKFYIGKHKASKHDPDYLGSGNYIIAAIKKYGKENFSNEVIDTAESLNELNEKEKKWIRDLDAQNKGYNIAPGGDGGEIWGSPSNHPSLGKEGLKGENNPWYKALKDQEVRAKFIAAMRDRRCIVSPDGRRKFVHWSAVQSYVDQGWRCPRWEEEERKKLPREKHPGRKPGIYHHTEETKRKIKESNALRRASDPTFQQHHSDAIKQALAARSGEDKEAFREMRRRIQTGKIPSAETRKKCSETLKRGYAEGRYKTTKGKPAWNKGLKMSDEQKAKLGDICRGRIHITNGSINKMIHPEEFDQWEAKGFYRGRTLKK